MIKYVEKVFKSAIKAKKKKTEERRDLGKANTDQFFPNSFCFKVLVLTPDSTISKYSKLLSQIQIFINQIQ